VEAGELALDIEKTVAVGIRVLRSDTGANHVASGFPIETSANRYAHLGQFGLRLSLQHRDRSFRSSRRGPIQAGNGQNQGAEKVLSSHRLTHPSSLKRRARSCACPYVNAATAVF
jgi:hypothetical protein